MVFLQSPIKSEVHPEEKPSGLSPYQAPPIVNDKWTGSYVTLFYSEHSACFTRPFTQALFSSLSIQVLTS